MGLLAVMTVLMTSLVTLSICYFLVGLPAQLDVFAQFYGVICLLACTAQVIAIVIGCAVANAESAVQKLPPVIINFMLFAGLLIPKSKIPDWFIWIYYINPFAYAFKLLMYAGLQGQGNCTTVPSVTPNTSDAVGVVPPTITCEGDELLNYFGVKDSDRLPAALVLVGIITFMTFIGYFLAK